MSIAGIAIRHTGKQLLDDILNAAAAGGGAGAGFNNFLDLFQPGDRPTKKDDIYVGGRQGGGNVFVPPGLSGRNALQTSIQRRFRKKTRSRYQKRRRHKQCYCCYNQHSTKYYR